MEFKIMKLNLIRTLKKVDGSIFEEKIEVIYNTSENYIYSSDGILPTLTATGAQSRIKIEHNKIIRQIQPEEAILFMGFTKNDFQKIKNTGISDTSIVKMAGNSIVVQALEHIFSNLKLK